MGIIKDQIKDEIKSKFREQVALNYQKQNPTKLSAGDFLKPQFRTNIVSDITRLTKGIIGMGYQAARHPIKSSQAVGATGLELVKTIPKTLAETPKNIFGFVKNPIKKTKEAYQSYKDLRNIPYEKQKEFFSGLSEKALQEKEKGKKGAMVLGSSLIGAFAQEVSHPMEYFYENPFTMTLDALFLGKASGINKVVVSAAKKIPAVKAMSGVMKEAFLPHGKLVNAGYKDLANDFMKTKSTIFKVQKEIVEDTSNKFTKVFKLDKAERLDFFDSIDKLRRVEPKGITKPVISKIKPIIKELEPLAKETDLITKAKKFVKEGKSAEEFVKSQKGQFHGTSLKIKKLMTDEEMYSPLNIYGQGFYTTDKLNIAFSYIKKGTGKEQSVYKITEKGKVSIYNMEQKLSDDLLKKVNKTEIAEFEPFKKGTTMREVYDEIRRNTDITVDTAQELMDDLKQILIKKGYKGISHKGGILTKGEPHNVKIYWNPKRDINIIETQTKSQLTDIYNQTTKAVKPVEKIVKPIFATSKNPKVQTAINWWLKEEVPKLQKASGLSKENAITNYLHHYFPDKVKGLGIGKPIQYAKKGYLKKSKDVGGFTKEPILSISAIKSKVSIDIIKDTFIKKTIHKYSFDKTKIEKIMTDRLEIDKVAELKKIGRLDQMAMKLFDLEEYKPKGSLRFYPLEKGVGVSKKVETHLMPKIIADELNKFTNPKTGIIDKMCLPFDIFNRNWKPLATAVRPRYHTRNIVGNIYNAIVIGKTSPKQIPIAIINQVQNHIFQSIKSNNLLGKIYKGFYKKDIPQPEIMKLAIDNDVIGRGFFAADLDDLARAVENSEDIMKTIKRIKTPSEIATPIRPLSKIKKLPNFVPNWIKTADVNLLGHWLGLTKKVGEFCEDNARLAMFQQGIKKWGKGIKGIQKSKDYVNEHLFDYLTGLGEADKYIKRIVPFWAWTRFNVPLQLKSLVSVPERHLALQKGTVGYTEAKEKEDKGYKYLSEKQKEMGYFKVGTTEKGGKQFDKYIKTASVLPQQDLARLVNLFRGETEEIGFTPLFQIFNYIFKAPTEVLNYFGQPIERFEKEKFKFLGMSITGKRKAILSTIPILTEINKLIGGSYRKGEMPSRKERLETVISPTGLSLIDPKTTKFFHELEKQKKISGSWDIGWTSLYKRNFKIYQKNKEKYAKDNMETLEKLLLSNGYTKIELAKLKGKAIKSLFQELIRDKLKK